jgi:cephalosporin-C deacetylase-like acetyl esterase
MRIFYFLIGVRATHGEPTMLRIFPKKPGSGSIGRRRYLYALAIFSLGNSLLGEAFLKAQPPTLPPGPSDGLEKEQKQSATMLRDYYRQMCVPKPLVVRKGQELVNHRRRWQDRLLDIVGLKPLPARVPLDVHASAALDHPWCTVQRIHYQLWPNVYSSGLLYMPKNFRERPAPAMLCPHGHWNVGNAHPDVQKRCLVFARLGYVVFSSTQNHFEDLYAGVSHQTLMVWNNMRALDFLESLPGVDRTRIGVAGESGGGLQTEMLTALDARVRAATIVGLTCDFREIMFPDACHCVCNHFPGVMRFTDHPEISTLGLPAAVQYLTMNDWTLTFEKNNFPTIRALYAANGLGEAVHCKFFDTPHNYDQPKREETYRWMERWVRGRKDTVLEKEPADVRTFPIETLQQLGAKVPEDRGFAEISRIYRDQRGYRLPALNNLKEWQRYRDKMTGELRELLGEDTVLPRQAMARTVSTVQEGELTIERVRYPSEGPILVPAIVLRNRSAKGKLPVVVLLGPAGKEALLGETGSHSARSLAHKGSLVVLPDVRGSGEMLSTGTKNEGAQRQAWERNGIVWGRPVPGMAATDLRGVLDGIAERPDAEKDRVGLRSRGAGDLALAAIFAAGLDCRITAFDVDLAGCCYAKRNLPLVSGVLKHGDVCQWAALLAQRQITLRRLPKEAGDPGWLTGVFKAAGNRKGLPIEP